MEGKIMAQQNQNKIEIQNINNEDASARVVEVLYQKMNGRWYAFSLVDDDVFVGSVSEEEIAAAEGTGVEKYLEMPDTNLNEPLEAV